MAAIPSLSNLRPDEVENIRSPDGYAAFFRCKGRMSFLRGSSVRRIDLRLVWMAFSFDHRAEDLTWTETVIILRLNEEQWRFGFPDGFEQSLPQFSIGPRHCCGSEGDESA